MANYKLKNGHTLELSGGRGTISGLIDQTKYDALLKENPAFENEFDTVPEETKTKGPKQLKDNDNG